MNDGVSVIGDKVRVGDSIVFGERGVGIVEKLSRFMLTVPVGHDRPDADYVIFVESGYGETYLSVSFLPADKVVLG